MTTYDLGNGSIPVKTTLPSSGVLYGADTPTTTTPAPYSQAAVTSFIVTFGGSSAGLVPTSAGGTANFLRADGTWAAPPGGGGGSPGGSSGQIQYNNSGAFGGFTVGGDGTLNTSTGGITITKTNGTAFAASATTDTTNASNISSGTLAAARLPNPSASTLGGVKSLASTAHQFLTQIGTDGSVLQAQPAAADVSGLAASATTDTTNASNISSGTLSAARLPNPSASTLGGIESIAAQAHKWINTISTSGVPSLTQPASTDLSDSANLLYNNASSTITVGYPVTPYSGGTITSGTLTPSVANGSQQYITANGAFTLAPPSSASQVMIEVTNGASAGAITTSGFTKVTGDSYATTNGNKFLFFITKSQTYSHLNIVALQ